MPTDTIMTHHWTALADGRIQCDVCPRECKLGPGQRGLCFVRARPDAAAVSGPADDGATKDGIVLTTYGRSSGFCIDPIEKKPLNHFLPGTPVLSFGTAGCNLACSFCQNWDISKSRQMDTLAGRATPYTLAVAAKQSGARAVAFTYNDPVIFLEYAIDVAAACRQLGIKTVAVTAGYINPPARAEFYRWMDAANIDLKAFTEDFYWSITKSHLQPVLDTLLYLKHETQVWFEITNLVIPGVNDSDQEITELSRWVARELGPDVPVHFSAFHPDYKMRDRPRTPPATLVRAREIAQGEGLRYVYVGNVHDPARASTYCHGCGSLVMARDWYQLGRWGLDEAGVCTTCGTPCAGVFDGPPGQWGRARKPIQFGQQVKIQGTAPALPSGQPVS